LILREPHPSDSRARSLAVTEEGARLANAATAAIEAADRRFFGPLGHSQPDFTIMLRTLLPPE
jgi:DNA-binding MarR family transcriptional regulator